MKGALFFRKGVFFIRPFFAIRFFFPPFFLESIQILRFCISWRNGSYANPAPTLFRVIFFTLSPYMRNAQFFEPIFLTKSQTKCLLMPERPWTCVD